MKPPIKPSTVLLGLILGAIEFLPKLEPIKYAKLSKIAVLRIKIKIQALVLLITRSIHVLYQQATM